MLAFVVLTDSPAQSESFRPLEDESQWWSRRDALVRIVYCSCYCSQPSTQLAIVFNASMNGNQGKATVLYTNAQALRREILVPTEQRIIAAWKQASKMDNRSKSSFLSTNLSAMQFATISLAPATSRSHHRQQQQQQINLDNCSKKELLNHLQAYCPLEFLRQHHLNGSKELILKNKNKQHLLQAWTAWMTQQDDNDSNANDNNASSTKDSTCKSQLLNAIWQDILTRYHQQFLLTMSNNSQLISNNNNSKKRSFSHLSTPSSASSSSSSSSRPFRVAILLLHEDYPDELPVFGPMVEGDDAPLHPDAADNNNDVPDLIICMLGAVRDMTEEEIQSLHTTVFQHQQEQLQQEKEGSNNKMEVVIVTANLGRTAEFTSKIILAINIHHSIPAVYSSNGDKQSASRMQMAIAQLIHRQRQRQRQEEAIAAQPSQSSNMLYHKLSSIRSNHRTWDGYHTNSVKKKAISSTTASNPEKVVQDDDTVAMETGCTTTIVSTAKVDIPSTAITLDLSSRQTMLPAIQLIVYTLWKSRMVSDYHQEEAEEEEGNVSKDLSNKVEVQCLLYLCFSDSLILRIDQSRIVQEVEAHHTPAPSEYQILSMLIRLLQDETLIIRQAIASSSDSDEIADSSLVFDVEDVIKYIIDDYLTTMIGDKIEGSKEEQDKKHRKWNEKKLWKRIRILLPNHHHSHDSSKADEHDESLSTIAYNTSCLCSSNSNNSVGNNENLILFAFYGFQPIPLEEDRQRITETLYEVRFQKKYKMKERDMEDVDNNSKKSMKQEERIQEMNKLIKFHPIFPLSNSTSSSSNTMSIPVMIIMLQHWAYHHTLWPAVK